MTHRLYWFDVVGFDQFTESPYTGSIYHMPYVDSVAPDQSVYASQSDLRATLSTLCKIESH